MISGRTKLIAHLGYPTENFKAPMIYNPYFEREKIDAVVVPMGCRAEDYPTFFKLVFKLSNAHGALITMPHKITTTDLVDTLSATAAIAGSCNAVRIASDGRLAGDMFDGEGFVRGVAGKGCHLVGARALVVGSGGVGSAIAASLAKAGVSELMLFDSNAAAAEGLASRLSKHYRELRVATGSNDPYSLDIVVNATPLGMQPGDPMPLDVSRLTPSTFVGEVVMAQEITPFLAAARARGCEIQVGKDMLYEQIPAYLEFFGFPLTTADALRDVSLLD